MFGCLLLSPGLLIYWKLPAWLGRETAILGDASADFLVYCLSLQVLQLNDITGGMLQCSGNMQISSLLHIMMCGLDVLFTALAEVAATVLLGLGYDVHRLVVGRKLILGGMEIPHALGLLGHSGADVLAHAVMDALLGAAALGDIREAFSGYGRAVQRDFQYEAAGTCRGSG